MKVKAVANLVGISVRTLHHYDAIGLLKPDETTASGHRMYSQQNIDDLQQILFFRALNVPLQKIKVLMHSPDFDRQRALQKHRSALITQQQQISKMIDTIDRTILYERGEITMANEEKFKGFDFSKGNPYEQEAHARWGKQAVERANEKMRDQHQSVEDRTNQIYFALADIRHLSPSSDEVQILIKQWFELLNEIGSYSLDAFVSLGDMYVADQRFTKNIDQFGEGLASLMRDAMNTYATKNRN